jgi:hypothetical protein
MASALKVAYGLTVEEWASERLANSLRIAATKFGEDRRSWLEDVAYWREIVRRLSQRVDM